MVSLIIIIKVMIVIPISQNFTYNKWPAPPSARPPGTALIIRNINVQGLTQQHASK